MFDRHHRRSLEWPLRCARGLPRRGFQNRELEEGRGFEGIGPPDTSEGFLSSGKDLMG